jgi:hypothetical protein
MTIPLLGAVLLIACSGEEQVVGELRLDGPTQLRVDQLGPVEAPDVVLEDGTIAEVSWTLQAPGVAVLDAGQVVAQGPGVAQVTGQIEGQTVQWTLVVDPAVTLSFVEPPSSLVVGEVAILAVSARVGERSVSPGTIDWVSSDAGIATVSQGEVMAVGEGVTYLTAKAHGSEAMVEIEVVVESQVRGN